MEEDYVGIACGQCDLFVPMGTDRCTECGHGLSFGADEAPAAQAPSTPSQEELMEQARHYVCKECQSPVPSGQKFCGACGASVPQAIQDLQTEFFGALQAPGKARLILIRGDQGVDGLSYLLQGSEHVAGRQDAQILFPDDPWISPRHANFVYREGSLVVCDEGSTNGVYVRVTDSVDLQPGDTFLCGQEVFRLDAAPADSAGPAPDQTQFYASPPRPSPFRLVQLLEQGAEGMVICAGESSVQIGREGCDVNFPEDIYMSGTHAKVQLSGGDRFTLTDLGSRNGTYVRIRTDHALAQGDYLFLGHQLLRVEMTA
jgi:pSer/pThr/pTyr-binding forkhead associated (FHA) protein/RNA polymerase subunit RPABC4/transcription elongation factor Spt4